MDFTSEIFEILAKSPQEADQRAMALFRLAKSQEESDSINWARGYVLVELKRFTEALNIWVEIFKRTQSHKALHQIGFVHRSSGNLSEALEVFLDEKSLIEADDTLATAINLYELTYCNLLLKNLEKAHEFFHLYEELKFDKTDLIERGSFYRLKGDLYKITDRSVTMTAYQKSLKFFEEAKDDIACVEIKERMKLI